MSRTPLSLALPVLAALAIPATAHADAPEVVASIKPVHSLVARVMEGVGEPYLIVEGAGSPHTYALKPSDASALQGADLVFWVGENMEGFLAGPIANVASSARAVELGAVEGLTLLEVREGDNFDAHEEHAHEEHADHKDGHAHDEHEHEHAEKAHDDHSHEDHADHGHEGHAHGGMDMHIWLDPQNAMVMVDAIAAALADVDADNAATYNGNAEALKADITAMENEITGRLSPLTERPFVVFHDAYHYFENRFGLEAAASITVNPDVAPGAQRVRELQERLSELEAVCVFAEPQFDANIVAVITEGTSARTGVLDPLGTGLEDGPGLYLSLLKGIADEAEACLGNAS